MNGIPGRPVTRIRLTPGGFDADGDPVESTGSQLVIADCLVAPRTEDGESRAPGRHGVIVGLTLYAPLGSDIARTDLFDIDGERWAVEGEPGVWTPPWPSAPGGIEVALRRAVG